jgi:23S rRNA (guanine1835-N2)-methyltransferase
MTRWSLPGRILELRRWPPRADDPLQAWDGADRHLVAAVEEEDLGGPLLVVGDAWGALATALGDRVGGSWGDSVLGERATGANRARAGLPPLPWTPSTARPAGEFAGALVRVPRAHRRLRFWLAELAAVLPSGAPVWIGGRHGDVTRRVVAAAEAMGPAEASLQRHKARIVRTSVQRRPAPPEPRSVEVEGVRLRPRPGVFGEDGLDDGAALLLRHLPAGAPRRVLDLGCGSGVLGLVAQARWPEAALTFCDASHLAVASARDGATTGWRRGSTSCSATRRSTPDGPGPGRWRRACSGRRRGSWRTTGRSSSSETGTSTTTSGCAAGSAGSRCARPTPASW